MGERIVDSLTTVRGSPGCLSPHLNASPGAHSLGEVICPTAVFDTGNFPVLDWLQFLSLVQLPLSSQHRELFVSVKSSDYRLIAI